VRWDEGGAATPHGQLVFFAEFLAATGVFERWVAECPLSYRSGNAPDKRDVLGRLMLGLLAGHRRYAHITALRGDAVAAQALGMNKVVSEDALRRALERIDEAASAARRTSTAARPWPGPARWSTTSGVGIAGPHTHRDGWKPSQAVRCCWPRWARPPATPTRPRCTSPRCTAGPMCSSG
jgi:hypothetical protein